MFEKVLKEAIKAQYTHKGIRYLVCQLGCMKVKTETSGWKSEPVMGLDFTVMKSGLCR